ncbi:MAG: DUF2267 domain-containing protein [Anaerolineales bacterium]|nr:DUF2267 domain-containing protein [Anaerolineales bacterium]
MAEAVLKNSKISTTEEFFDYVKTAGKLRTADHARTWTRGTLNMLGVNIDRGVKKELANALPEEFVKWLKGGPWLLHFRDTNISSYEFQNRVARRSSNSDPQFAYYPVKAVFGGLKRLLDQNVGQNLADNLSPELREIWNEA